VLIVGSGAIVASVGVALGQVIQWRRDGVWTEIPFSVLWVAFGGSAPPDPLLMGRGAETPVTWFLGLPVSLVLFLFGAVLAWIGGTRMGQRYSRF